MIQSSYNILEITSIEALHGTANTVSSFQSCMYGPLSQFVLFIWHDVLLESSRDPETLHLRLASISGTSRVAGVKSSSAK